MKKLFIVFLICLFSPLIFTATTYYSITVFVTEATVTIHTKNGDLPEKVSTYVDGVTDTFADNGIYMTAYNAPQGFTTQVVRLIATEVDRCTPDVIFVGASPIFTITRTPIATRTVTKTVTPTRTITKTVTPTITRTPQ
jgi:hypothetical protein